MSRFGNEHRRQLHRGELIPHRRHPPRPLQPAARRRPAADELRHRRMLARRRMGLHPVPPADHAQQLIIGRPGAGIILPGGFLGELAQRQAARRGIQRHHGREPRRPADILTREAPGRPGHPRTPAPVGRRDRAHRGIQPQPVRHRPRPDRIRGHLRRLGIHHGQPPVIQPDRQVLRIHAPRPRVLILRRELILRQSGRVLTVRPARAGRHQPPPPVPVKPRVRVNPQVPAGPGAAAQPGRLPAGILVPPGSPVSWPVPHPPPPVRQNDSYRT